MRISLQHRRGERSGMPNEAEARDERQRAILAILRRTPVRGQDDLVRRLAERGFAVTQSSVSRDLRDLGVAKVGGRYLPPPSPSGAAGELELEEIAHYLRASRPAGPYLVVVLTQVGAAQTVGIGLDRAGWPEVVGTIAGDDTVFVATSGARDQTRLLHRLRALVADLEARAAQEPAAAPGSRAANSHPLPVRPGARTLSADR
jgi:transcriptional regulator of arginine metabolism